MSFGTQTRGRDVLALAALLAILLAWGALYVGRTSIVLPQGERVFTLWDDAMISMQYARNLRRGEGLVWSPGDDRVQGFTNPGVTLLMAAVHTLPLDSRHTSAAVQALALLMLAAIPILLWGISRRLLPESRQVALAAALGTAVCAPVAIWSLQGSDVGFVTVWLAACGFVASRRPLAPTALIGLLALGPWIRPDVAIYAPFFLFVAREGGDGRRTVVLGALGVATSLLAWATFAWLYYGDPLPNTWYLKATGSPRHLVLLSGASELVAWLPRLAAPLALAGLALAGRWRDRRVAMLGGVVCVAQAYSVWVGGDFVFGWGSRFAVPSLPFLILLAAMGADRVLAHLAAGPSTRVAAVITAGPLLAGIASPPLSAREWLDPRTPTLLHRENASNLHFADYLKRHTDPTTTLGAHWGGVPPYFSERPAIDVLGKSDRHIARLAVPRFIPGHSKWDWDYIVNERRPDVLRAPSRGLGKRPDFRRAYLKVETGEPELSFFMRRTALSKLLDPRAILIDPIDGQRYRLGPDRQHRPAACEVQLRIPVRHEQAAALVGLEDLATAALVYRRACERGIGRELPL